MKPRELMRRIRLRNFANISFDDFVRLVQAYGFRLQRTAGSHHIYRHAGIRHELSLQPDRSGDAKPYQVRQFLTLVERYRLSAEGIE
ncbi:MAG: type II toxin-antitoxin system HicA family toxin [Dehalococcoidia bacterium]